MNKNNRLSPESRVSTRAILRQLAKDDREDGRKSYGRLHPQEVGAFMVQGLKVMWRACDDAELTNHRELVEILFAEAFYLAGGKPETVAAIMESVAA